MTPHPHAELFRAIANGEDEDEIFQCQFHEWSKGLWEPIGHRLVAINLHPSDWTVRRKPRTIRIGEKDVPEPMRVAPAVGTHYWIVSVSEEFSYSSTWAGDKSDFYCLERGLCQLTKEAAEQHRKALILVSGGTP